MPSSHTVPVVPDIDGKLSFVVEMALNQASQEKHAIPFTDLK